MLDPEGLTDLWLLKPKEDGSGHISAPTVQTRFRERAADLSPDWKFLAYTSDESGKEEVCVQEFPAGGREQVSVGGGSWPHWGKTGRELFYVAGDALMRVPVRPGRGFSAGKPQEVFRSASLLPSVECTLAPYAPSPDGQQFLAAQAASDQRTSRIRIVKNWFADGRPRRITAAKIKQIVDKTTREKPTAATLWSTRTMAAAVHVSEATVRRIWQANGLKPHLTRTFKVSNDPHFAEKLEVNCRTLPQSARARYRALRRREEPVQALDRTQPGFPLKKGRCGTMTHDYKRNGTETLFAALNTLDSTVISMCDDRHRHQKRLKFLRVIDNLTPEARG